MSARRSTSKRRVLVVTGARSEFGLLRPVMEAIRKRKTLELLVAVAGEHLLKPAYTWKEVAAEYRIDAKVPMQRAGEKDRLQHAAACARGMEGFAAAFKKLKPDWVVVLGDRIEAFAAASAASIGGIGVCHIHGGDRAEGIADEAMRHAITKLAHLHCAATKTSAERIVAMGERKANVHVTGSPAIDGLARVKALGGAEARRLGDPRIVLLLHPSGLGADDEEVRTAWIAGWAATESWEHEMLALMPNADPGSEAIRMSLRRMPQVYSWVRVQEHMPRALFVGLLKRLGALHRRGEKAFLIGNSSAGLIECAALGVPVINVGRRQEGRERGANVFDVPEPRRYRDRDGRWLVISNEFLDAAGAHFRDTRVRAQAMYGDGRAGARIAALLARFDPHAGALMRKRNSY